MVEIFLRRTFGAFELLAILFVLLAAGSKKVEGYRRGEVLAMKIMLGSLANATRYQWIERSMRNHLRNDPEADSSFLHVLVHPKVNPRIAQSVLKACMETKSVVICRDEKNAICRSCKFNETCSKITKIVGIYEEVYDINPCEWKNYYGLAWNSRSKIALWLGRSISRNDTLDKIKFEEILANFWSINTVNVVLLVMPWCESENNCSENAKPRVFGYDPFVPRSGRSGKRGKLFERSIDEPLFPDKLKNLHGMPIRVSMYQQEPHAVLINYTKLGSGIEPSYVRYISNWLNFTVELISAPTTLTEYTIDISDGQKVGPIGDILNDRSDFLGNTEFVQSTWGRKVEFLQPFEQAYTEVLVPQADLIPGFFRIFHGADSDALVLIFVSSLILVCYFVVRKKRHPLFKTFDLLIHQRIKDIGDRTSERIFSISWIIWAFIICTVTQSQLIKDLHTLPFYMNIDTLEQLASSPLTLMIKQVDVNSLHYSKLKIKNRLAERAVIEPNFTRCTEILVAHRNVSCAIDEIYISQVVENLNGRIKRAVKQSNSQRKKKIVHVTEEFLAEYWRTVVVQDGFPYLNKFNVAYSKISEFGLIKKWWIPSQQFKTDPSSTTYHEEGLNDFAGAFKILLFGQIVAFVVFLMEIIFYHLKRYLQISSCSPPSHRVFTDIHKRSHTSKLRLKKPREVIRHKWTRT